MPGSPRGGRPDVERDEEQGAWLRLDSGELAVRVRHLGDLLKRGVSVTDARLVQGAEETWTIWVRLSDRPGEYRVNQVRQDLPKTYKSLDLAVETVWNEFGYLGAIVLSTERRRAPRPTTGTRPLASDG